VVFSVPEKFDAITDRKGKIKWGRVEAEHFRLTTSYQYKSVLKHAGVVEDTGLGGGKDLQEDIWARMGARFLVPVGRLISVKPQKPLSR
jgi:hypothetical protein